MAATSPQTLPSEPQTPLGAQAFLHFDPVGLLDLGLLNRQIDIDEPDPSFSPLQSSTPPHKNVASTALEAMVDHLPPAEPSLYDLDSLADADNLLDFLTTPRLIQATSMMTSQASPRSPREVERRVSEDLKHLVYVPQLHAWIVEFMSLQGHNGDLSSIRLSPDDVRQMGAGPLCANSVWIVRSEADVEYRVRAGQAHPVVEALKKIHPELPSTFCCHKGVAAGLGPTYAYTDLQIGLFLIEIKTILSIAALFISQLLHLDLESLHELREANPHAQGFHFDFEYPTVDHNIDAPTQPVVQIWTQLSNTKGACFAMGSSDDHAFFVVKDALHPNTLFISPCLPTFPSSDPTSTSRLGDTSMSADKAVEFASVIMFHLARLANSEQLRDDFFAFMRSKLNEGDSIIDVRPESVGKVGDPRPPPRWQPNQPAKRGKGKGKTKKAPKPTCGVKYYLSRDKPTASASHDKGKGKAKDEAPINEQSDTNSNNILMEQVEAEIAELAGKEPVKDEGFVKKQRENDDVVEQVESESPGLWVLSQEVDDMRSFGPGPSGSLQTINHQAQPKTDLALLDNAEMDVESPAPVPGSSRPPERTRRRRASPENGLTTAPTNIAWPENLEASGDEEPPAKLKSRVRSSSRLQQQSQQAGPSNLTQPAVAPDTGSQKLRRSQRQHTRKEPSTVDGGNSGRTRSKTETRRAAGKRKGKS
ncbi:hypothetical protein MIND_00826300 [Mycena indigotica]|uniref:Uncharacterized protein n=1 Tax=Mycena indigotica TaxID=2126181 RepID=A0A8H6VYT2_9AGAR|nr:uncharacterized protein MIND_00826300 [Mycena indigotica]KAF7298787.1 hypothetical protein MIND_00826300 [Mycena indigotica]